MSDWATCVVGLNPWNSPTCSPSSVLLPRSVLFDRGIKRFQPEVEPSQPVALEGRSDSGSPVRLRFKTIKLQSGSSQCTPLHAALPPTLRVCLCCTEVFFTFKEKKKKRKKDCLKKKKWNPYMMRFETTDSPWAGKKAGVCVTPILARAAGSPTSPEEVCSASGPTDSGDQARTLTELWGPCGP